MKNVGLNFKEIFSLKFQRFIGWFTFPVWGGMTIAAMRFGAGYRISHLRQIRKKYREILKSNSGPLLVCPNHLTMIDSVILNWSFVSVWSYLKSIKAFSWNLPEKNNFYKNPILRSLCHFGFFSPREKPLPDILFGVDRSLFPEIS